METGITADFIVPFLFIFTIAAIIIFALVSKKRTDEREESYRAPKSTLAKDAPNKR